MKSINFLLVLLICTSLFFAQEKIKNYQNYDFIAGNKILFEDNFSDSRDGEFPPMWKLILGQGVINKIDGEPVFVLTEGNYVKVAPRIKAKSYLDKAFTIECDYLAQFGEHGLIVFFITPDGDDSKAVRFDPYGRVFTNYFPESSELKGEHPDYDNDITGKWRHVAIAYKNGQMKCYVDQYRVLVIPDCEAVFTEVVIGGIAPVHFRNVKIANGAGMNMLDQIYKDGKFITHGILFDVNKAIVKPSSMGVLNEVVKMMKEHSDLKFSVDGHTDSDGDDKSNQKLSEQRADAVKKILVELGVDGSRLQSKGWGESKPIGKNDSPEGKANNRRVEFVKI